MRTITIGGLTATYEEHEFRACQKLVRDGHANAAALIHQIKATFDATLERDFRDTEPVLEQLRIA